MVYSCIPLYTLVYVFNFDLFLEFLGLLNKKEQSRFHGLFTSRHIMETRLQGEISLSQIYVFYCLRTALI